MSITPAEIRARLADPARRTDALDQPIIIDGFAPDAAPGIGRHATSSVRKISGGRRQRASADPCPTYSFVANERTSTRAAVWVAHKHEERAKPGASKQGISIHELSSVSRSFAIRMPGSNQDEITNHPRRRRSVRVPELHSQFAVTFLTASTRRKELIDRRQHGFGGATNREVDQRRRGRRLQIDFSSEGPTGLCNADEARGGIDDC